jgi:putative ABC transport system ATP-binding protein
MDYLIQTKNLHKQYGKGDNVVHALRSTNITIKQGEFTAIIGPSGSGKSTLLHMLGGLDSPSGGSVYFNNQNLAEMKDAALSKLRRRNFGFVFQSFNLVPIFSVRENILLPILLDGGQADQAYIKDIVRLLKLEERLGHLPGAISGGQQQRVALARALANRPDILFADEPTGNLDTKTSSEVLKLLRVVQQEYQQTMIMVTHDVSIAEKADRIIEIVDGAVVKDTGGTMK